MSQKVFKGKAHPITTDYRISDKVLGLGINGKVVECHHKTNGQKYALKVWTVRDCFGHNIPVIVFVSEPHI